MAVFECKSEEQDDKRAILERIEVRPWWIGGKRGQEFAIGSGGNFTENSNFLIEIIYSINDVQFFYTRNFVHYVEFDFSITERQEMLDKFKSGERDAFGFGDMLPETSIHLTRENKTYEEHGEQKSYAHYRLELWADIGAGICHESPGMRMINIKLELEDPQPGIEFMQQLLCEVADLLAQKHPDPAKIPEGSSDWSFTKLVYQKAYDQIALDYEEHYFSEPPLTEMFDAWLDRIPQEGHILDLGCGHGKPVIARLLERGFRVTGADISPVMLRRARLNFPNVTFVNQPAGGITFDTEFEGACSLSSLLYLDPIDLSHGLYRLHCSLKRNGLLFLHAYDLHPNWRGLPYHIALDQWIWGWTYGMDEAVHALEEHGYFKVLLAKDVTPEEARQKRIDDWYNSARENYEEQIKQSHNLYPIREPDKSKPPVLSYKYAIVAQAQGK